MQLVEFTLEDGRNLHVEVKVQADSLQQIPVNVHEVWNVADHDGQKATSSAERGYSIGQQIRCSLIQASLASKAESLSPDLLVALVKWHKLSPTEAIIWASLRPNPINQARSLLELASVLPPDSWEQTLEEFSLFSSTLPDPDWLKHQTLASYVHPRSKDEWRSHFLAKLLPYFPKQLQEQKLHEVIEETLKVEFLQKRTEILDNAVSFLSEAELRRLISRALELPAYYEEQHRFPRAESAKSLLPQLARLGYGDEAYNLAIANLTELDLAETLVRIAPYLSEVKRVETLLAARNAALLGRGGWFKQMVWSKVAFQFAEMNNMSEASASIELIEDENNRLIATARLFEFLPQDQADDVLARIRNPRGQTVTDTKNLCLHLVPQIARQQKIEIALDLIENVAWDDYVPVLRELLPTLIDLGFEKQLFEHANKLTYSWRQYQFYSVLARILPESLADKALAKAIEHQLSIGDQDKISKCLTHLASLLPEGDAKRDIALSSIDFIKDYIDDREPEEIEYDEFMPNLTDTFSTLASEIPESTRWEVAKSILEAVRALKSFEEYPYPADFRSLILKDLLPHVDAEHRREIIDEALSFDERVDDEENQSHAVIDLMPYISYAEWQTKIPYELWVTALEEKQAQPSRFHQSPAIQPKHPVLDREETQSILKKALQIDKSGFRAQMLAQAVPSILAQDSQEQVNLWTDLLHQLTQNRERVDILSDIQVLSLIVASIGDTTGIIEIAKAIVAVGKAF